MSIGFSYFDGNDTLRAIRYFSDQSGMEKTEGFYGVFCEKFRYDDRGNLIERQELDRSESWCYDKEGVHCYRYQYEGGRLTCEEFFGRENAPVESSRFRTYTISYEWSREKNHNILSVCFGSTPVTTADELVPTQSFAPNDFMESIYGFKDSVPMPAESKENNLYLPVLSQADAQLSALSEGQDTAPIGGQNDSNTEDSMVRNYAILRYSIAADNHRISAIRYCSRTGEPAVSEEGYAEKRLGYDNQAHIISESYYDAGGEPYLTSDGYASMSRSYDKDGRISEIIYLGLDGAPTNIPVQGYASVRYSYTQLAQREVIRTSYHDIQGKAVQPSSRGYAILEQTYNESGLLAQEAYFNADDAPAYCRDYRVAAILYEYSDSGDLIHEYYRDAGGMPINRSDKGYAVIHQEFERGQLVQRSYEGYVGHSLQPVPDRTTGAVVVKYRYQNGQIQWEGYYGADGEEYVLRRDTGYAACEYEYEDGRLCAQHFYGTDGSPVLRGDYGYAHRRNEYNKLGQLITIRYTGVKDEPVISTYYHCTGFDYRYDDQGNCSYVCYIGLDEKPLVRSDLGYAQLKRIYQKDKVAEEWYMDANGKPALCREGCYAHFEDDFDTNGNWTEGRYYDADGNQTLRGDRGYAVVKFTYNDDGQRVSERFYDTDGETLVISSYYHCAGFDYGYDSQGNCCDIGYIGLDEKPLVRSDLGYAQVKKTFQDGNVIAEAFFDAYGLPTPCKDGGNASYASVYEDGNWVESRYYDTAGELMRMNYGYALIQNTYDEFGQMRSSRFYDADEETPVVSAYYHCAGFDYIYDAQGNQIKVQYIGLDGKLMICSDLGYAQADRTFDEMGRLIREAYYDVNGQPVACNDGYASYKSVYENGLWRESSYFDTESKPVLRSDTGYAVIKNTYDAHGRYGTQRFYDTDGETPIVSPKYHCTGYSYSYDERGNQTYIWYIEPDKTIAVHSDLDLLNYMIYDDYYHIVWDAYYIFEEDTAILVPRKDLGYAAIKNVYEGENWIQTLYLDENEQPTINQDKGYASLTRKFNDLQQLIKESYYDETEGLTACKAGYAVLEYKYDESGNESDWIYYDASGEEINW